MLIVFTLPLPRVPVEGRLHPLSLLYLLTVSTYYALESSVQVAWLASAGPATGYRRAAGAAAISESDLVSCCSAT